MKTQTALTSLVKDINNKKFISIWDYIPSLISNIFSVIFSISIIFELKDTVNNIYVLTLLSVFIVLFLIMNEVIKVREIRKYFKGAKISLLTFSIAFSISITLASIGMYFFVNKTNEIKDDSNIEKAITINNIKLKYEVKLSELNSNSNYELSDNYKALNIELSYWKKLSSATLLERGDIRNKIDNLQKTIQQQRELYSSNKEKQVNDLKNIEANEISIVEYKYIKNINKTKVSDLITYIFLSLILVTEFATLLLNKIIAEKELEVSKFAESDAVKTYFTVSNVLTTLYLTKNKDHVTNIEKMKYSEVNKNNILTWEQICFYYNIFINLGILDDGIEIERTKVNGVSKILTNKFLITNEDEAQKLLDIYFEKYFKII